MKSDFRPDPELDSWLSDWADGVLDDASEEKLLARLRHDPAARQRYLDHSELDSALSWEYAAAAREGDKVSLISSSSDASWSRWVPSLAAAAILCVGLFFLSGESTKTVLQVEHSEGARYRVAGEEVLLETGENLPSGTLLLESPSDAAELKFEDGTLVTVNGEAEIDFAETADGKLLRVRSGLLIANVFPQPEGKPMRIKTPAAEVEVLGTILSVDTSAHATGLSVEEGKVRLRRLTDGQSVEVPAQHRTMASIHSIGALSVQESRGPRPDWKIRPRDVTKARRIEGDDGEVRYESVAYIAARREDGTKIVRNGISFNGELASLSPDSRIRIRYRGKFGPQLFLGTCKRSGHFGGNFEYDLHQDEAVAGVDGWKEAVVPIQQFAVNEKMADRGFRLEENILRKLLVSVKEGESFELLSVAVESERAN